MNEDGAVVLYSDVRVLLTVGKAIQVTDKRVSCCYRPLALFCIRKHHRYVLGKRSIEKRIPSDLN
jgi:hypothetical protein